MNTDVFNLSQKIYTNNNNILIGIVDDLNQIINILNNNPIIKRIGDIIIKINYTINENKKTRELIINQFYKIESKLDQLNQNLKINNINNQQELKGVIGRYVGQVVKGLAEGKGIACWNDGDRYEGEFRNNKREGKGIYYYNNGDRYEGDFKNDNAEGKGIYYWNDGDRYEGDFRNDKKEWKGIYYYNKEPL